MEKYRVRALRTFTLSPGRRVGPKDPPFEVEAKQACSLIAVQAVKRVPDNEEGAGVQSDAGSYNRRDMRAQNADSHGSSPGNASQSNQGSGKPGRNSP
jgi:hypothetical protein